MNLKSITIVVSAIALTVGASSCGKEGCTDKDALNFDEKAKKDNNTCEYDLGLSGAITENRTLLGDQTYTLSGGVHVKEGVTLTIESGATIKSNPDEAVAYLLIERGAKLIAEGTASNPIVFTSGSSSPKAGDWGGIIVCGKAPINKGTEATAEVGDVLYGGTDANDNSGILSYIRVEYSGNSINDEKQHNGFTFNGVGDGTTVEFLESYYGNDDGFEFFGGTVNASNLVSVGSGDDCFDWTYGWTGSGSNWIAKQVSGIGDRGIEADNQSGANDAAPFSNPTLINVTLTGQGVAAGTDGIKLREGTMGNLSNVLITGFRDAVEIEHAVTVKHAISGDLSLSNITSSDATTVWAIKGAETESDSTAAATAISPAFGTSATGSSTDWTTGWTVGL
ncbi:MAG: hypothetical protein R2813_03650 [Flavobacteriales bacterium]